MNQRRPLILLLVWIWFFMSGHINLLKAQEEVLYFHKLSKTNGLNSNSNNYSVRKDSRAYVWINSLQGLTRFDGIRATTYLPIPGDSLSLDDANVQSPVFEDKSGDLWFNTAKSILNYSSSSDNFARLDLMYQDSIRFAEYEVLHYDSISNRLWFMTGNDVLGDFFPLFTMDVERPESLVLIDSIGEYYANGLQMTSIKDHEFHRLIIPKINGWEIRKYQRSGGHLIECLDYKQNPASRAYAFFPVDSTELWAGTDNGLVLTDFKNSFLKSPLPFQGKLIQKIRGICPYKDNILLIATEKDGLFLFDKVAFRYTHQIATSIGAYQVPFQHPIQEIYLDAEHNLWIITLSQGIFYTNLKKKRFESHLQQRLESRISYNVKSVTEDLEDNLWSLTDEGIIITDKNGNILPSSRKIDNIESALIEKKLYYIHADRAGGIWVCTNHGLFHLAKDETKLQPIDFDAPNGKRRIVVPYVGELQDGRILVATMGKGVFKISVKNSKPVLSRMNGDLDTIGRFTLLYENRQKQLLVSNLQKGIKIFDQKGDGYQFSQSIAFSPMIYSMREEPQSNKIWIGSAQGLYCLEKVQNTFKLKKDTLFSEKYLIVNSIEFDQSGQMWISTNRGLVAYQPKPSGSLPQEKLKIRTFGIADGLQESEFNFWSSTQTSDKLLVFGGTNGYTLFDPLNVPFYLFDPQPTITEVQINDQPLKESSEARLIKSNSKGQIDQLILAPKVRTFRFHFSSFEYGHSSINQFKYTLKLADGTLIQTGSEFSEAYTNLPAGDYLFTLDAFNSESMPASEPYQLKIKIRPHWTETKAFYVSLLALISLIIYRIYRSRLALARRKTQLAELETAILRIQMNPHFLFNSLNSIRAYIQDKDVRIAEKYLMHLAKLMRKILDYADQDYISLDKDLEILEAYMKAEMLRFENTFKYSIEIEDDFDTSSIRLPSMLLQPFVENSIIHGFKKTEAGGLIILRFKEEGDCLRCQIIDNGLGLKASKNLSKEHQSKALGIIKKRLKIVEEKMGVPTHFEIVDRNDLDSSLQGTQITLVLPIL